jgi:thiol-disulfide isomerase/thioredoxin
MNCKNEKILLLRLHNIITMKFIVIIAFLMSSNIYAQNSMSLDEIILQNKGRVVLVDYWASWCKPCRAAMKHLPKLKEKYKGKEITYVFISMDIQKDAWQAASIKEGIDKEEYNVMSPYMKKSNTYNIEINAIPRYLIFSKEGKLVNDNAPIDTKKLQKEIDKYITN